RARLAQGKKRVAWFAGLEHDEFAANHVARGLGVFAILLERSIIIAARYGTIEPIGDVAERGARAECPDSEVRHHLRRARTNFGIAALDRDRATRSGTRRLKWYHSAASCSGRG